MRIFLIDGSSLAYRGHFAFIRNPLRNSKGENTSAAFAFTNSIMKLLSEKKPEYILVAFDAPGPKHRHEKYEQYKAQRPKMPPELRQQIPIIKELLSAIGIKYYEETGLEADDIIGTFTKRGTEKGFEVTIFSDDKDFVQLLDDNVNILKPRDFKIYYKSNAKDWIGVIPEHVVDFLALTGDSIDNIPGIKGIGPKTAAALLEEYASLDGIYSNIDNIKKDKLKNLLIKEKDTAYLSRELAELEISENVPIDIKSLRLGDIQKNELLNLLTKLEFFSLIEKLGVSSQKQAEEVKTAKKVRIEELLEKDIDEIGVSLIDKFIAISTYSYTTIIDINNKEKIKELIKHSKKVVTDVSKDLFKLSVLDKNKSTFDVATASYLIEPSLGSYSLPKASLRYLSRPFPHLPKKPVMTDMSVCASHRASTVLRLYPILSEEIKKRDLESIYDNVDFPLSFVLAKMEVIGVLVDRNFFNEESKRLKEELQNYEEMIYSHAGMKFNINSPKQLSFILFEKLELPIVKRTKTGASTDHEVLVKLAPHHEMVELLLKYRETEKIRSTYIDAIPQLVETDGRVRTNWCQNTTSTGRLSSIGPNLQNIPQSVREGFIAPSDWLLLSSDYSQIELRIVASLSGDNTLKEAFEKNKDIHTRTAAHILGIPEESVGKKERGLAKMINFGIIYGMGAYGLSSRLGISVGDANQFINAYFKTYPKIKDWVERTIKEATEQGYTKTILGRKRYFETVNGADARAAINAPVQGSAADMIKIAMINIHNKLEGMKSRMILQVHDELVLEVPKEELSKVAEIVKREMEGAISLDVPVVCDIKVGTDWGKMDKFN